MFGRSVNPKPFIVKLELPTIACSRAPSCTWMSFPWSRPARRIDRTSTVPRIHSAQARAVAR